MNKLKTDWISSRPVYYNLKTKNFSHNLNDVIDWNNCEFDMNGLQNYLDFGYNVFDQTMIKDVKILRHSSEIYSIENNGKIELKIVENEDDAEKYFLQAKENNSEEALEVMKNHVQDWEKTQIDSKKRYLIPLSGGFDSRLLAYLVKDKDKIDAFTYGVSWDQKNSDEVANAKYIAEKLKINWQRIEVGNFNQDKYLEKNFDIFGPSIPMHTMYHMEFYDEIIKSHGRDYIVLSGSVGDWWSGEKVPLKEVNNPDQFSNIFFNHGICVSSSHLLNKKKTNEINEQVFEKYKDKLKDSRYRRLFMARGRNNLSHWITKLPEEIVGEVYTPYEDIDVAMSMMMLKKELSNNRKWQKDFFEKINLNPEVKNIKSDFGNKLDLYSMAKYEIEPLKIDLLKELFDKNYLESINNSIGSFQKSNCKNLFNIHSYLYQRNSGSLLKYINKKIYKTASKKSDKAVEAYNAWSVLKTIEFVLNKRKNESY